MSDKLKVAAVGAHPDDIEALMMGTLIKYKEQGHEVYIIILTDGQRGGASPGKVLAETRRREAETAAAHIGIKPIFLNFEDGRLVRNRESHEKVLDTFIQIRPNVIFTLDPEDYHTDHRATSRIVTDVAASNVPVFYCDTLLGVGFMPEYYIDITDSFDLKIKTLKEHKSQNGEVISEAVKLQNRFRGAQCGWGKVMYAEAYRFYSRYNCVNGYTLLPK